MRSEVLALVAAAGTDAALLFYAFSHFELFFVLFFGIIVAGGPLLRFTFLPQYPRRGAPAGPRAAAPSPARPRRPLGRLGPVSPDRRFPGRLCFSPPSLTAAP